MLRDAGRWRLDDAPRRFDAEDWWLRAHFDADAAALPASLHLDGLAGLADLWVNGRHVLHSENMFVAHVCPLRGLATPGTNTVHLRFAALDTALAPRRARPRWRAPMVEQQQLRWFRQTLLGRTPGWTPPAAAVGPWRDVWLDSADPACVPALRAELGADGAGLVHVVVDGGAAPAPRRIALELARDGRVFGVDLHPVASLPTRWEARLRIERPQPWWPHTHGEPALYSAVLRIWDTTADEPRHCALQAVGFRRVTLHDDAGDFELRVNDVPVFCRGACWMPLDVVSLRAEPEAYRCALAQVRDAGMNMLRVSGATVYEEEAFFAACDEAGVLVWQDFMFANMDYPADDPAFVESVRVEALQQLARWCGHPSLALVCGNSEVEQQAAMWGAPRELWAPALFHELLRRWTAEQLPELPYWPSSAHGGAFPHQADQGSSSYYGVGAYLRAPEDARRAHLRFATECLGFANVPEPATIARMPQGPALKVHHPAWKARAPRDLGAGWDFEDVRDHYLKLHYGIDPLRCRYADHERYLALSRVVTGELMADAFAEWRRPASSCRGALVWLLRDLWAGAGWGLQDDQGQPKACWYLLRRALQPVAVSMTDEGGNGLAVHLVNERPQALGATLRVDLFGVGEARVAQAERGLELPERGARTMALAGLFDGLFDLSYSYRFGPPEVQLVHLQCLDGAGRSIAEAFHFPAGRPALVSPEMPLSAAELRRVRPGELSIRLEATRFAQFVQLELDGYRLSDNHFHMAPGSSRVIVARAQGAEAAGAPRGRARPLNSTQGLPLRLVP
jgi:beta-mannosidase